MPRIHLICFAFSIFAFMECYIYSSAYNNKLYAVSLRGHTNFLNLQLHAVPSSLVYIVATWYRFGEGIERVRIFTCLIKSFHVPF